MGIGMGIGWRMGIGIGMDIGIGIGIVNGHRHRHAHNLSESSPPRMGVSVPINPAGGRRLHLVHVCEKFQHSCVNGV